MYDNIYMIFLHDPEVRLRLKGIRGSEKNVLEIRGKHGAAPAVGYGRPGALLDQIFKILVNTHMGTVHDLNNFPIDISGNNAVLLPFFIKGRRRSFCVQQFAFVLSPFIYCGFSHFKGDVISFSVNLLAVNFNRGFNTQPGSDLQELFDIFNLVSIGFLFCSGHENFGHAAAVI